MFSIKIGLALFFIFTFSDNGYTASIIPVKQDETDMVLVEAGDFVMGTGQGQAEESPPQVRRLASFYIDRTEVTCAQYARFVKDTSKKPPSDWVGGVPPTGRDKYPITNITWFEAMCYALWAGKRLPTEAEWEKAARGTDGRLYPWGDEDDKSRRNKDSGTLQPVGQYSAGVSPYGCLDMSGNAWEWTADGFDAYPGSGVRSIHFDRQYKVIRGGAGEYLYGTLNTGTTTQRARLVPYGSHDFIGFRCVRDAPGANPPYDPHQRLQEAEKQLQRYLRKPRELTCEKQLQTILADGKIPLTIHGRTKRPGHIRTGFPLPQGRLRDVRHLHLSANDGTPIPVQPSVLSRWSDGSIRWALLDFHAASGQTVEVHLTAPTGADLSNSGVRIRQENDQIILDNGKIRITLSADKLIRAICVDNQSVVSGTLLELKGKLTQSIDHLSPLAADTLEIEDRGPQYAQVRLQGFFADEHARKTGIKYDLRIGLSAYSPRITLFCTIIHHALRQEPWEEMKPCFSLSDARLYFDLANPIGECALGTENGQVQRKISGDKYVELIQINDQQYEICHGESLLTKGTRAPGWLAVPQGPLWIGLGVRHFWQNYPQALAIHPRQIGVGLFAGTEPFSWEGGLAKTHEIVLDFSSSPPDRLILEPLRAVIPPIWACGSRAAGALMPRDQQSLQTLPYWECWRETAMQRWVNGMPFGRRDFGDAYMGGPYKGKNAYVNLEYDVAWNFLLHYLRTGDVWFLDIAEPMVRHQGDIDTENVAGFAWKHSPMHTTTRADLGHVFIRGLLLHYVLTGQRRSLETAIKIGDWLAGKLERDEGVGNERQIGWSLYALTALFEVTGEPRYLRATETLTNRLIASQSPTGKFDIRWDNRIAFFNGIAMNGMLTVQEITGHTALQDSIMNVARRTSGMYPEYACRTLNAYCWVVAEYQDPRFLDNLERTWQSSLEFLLDRDCTTAETHAWKFPRFAARYELFPLFSSPPLILPDAAHWKSIRFKHPQVKLFLRRNEAPAPIMIIREGLAPGRVRLWDLAGNQLYSCDLTNTDRMFEAAAFSLPPTTEVYRLQLNSPDTFGWQIHYDHAVGVTVYDPQHKQIPFLLPEAYGLLRPGTTKVKIKFEAMGEGFHSAVLYDPDHCPRQAVRHFVDFEDPGCYELTLQADVAGLETGWSLQLHDLNVLEVEGFLPYWSCDPKDLFCPEGIFRNCQKGKHK